MASTKLQILKQLPTAFWFVQSDREGAGGSTMFPICFSFTFISSHLSSVHRPSFSNLLLLHRERVLGREGKEGKGSGKVVHALDICVLFGVVLI